MADEDDKAQDANVALPNVDVPSIRALPDYASILGLVLSFSLIASAILIGQSNADFFNLPSVLIVIIGTMTATCISYTVDELIKSGPKLLESFVRPVRDFPKLASAMMDLAVAARKKGVLQISNYENETQNEPFLNYAMRLVVDGYNPEDIQRILQQDIDTEEELHNRAASILRRASEVAPAMGLIGTLVGLVQMLADLENPDTIGPAMAVALLTTFYGAIMGTVVLAPLAAKIEKNAADEVTAKTMTLKTAQSMLRQENPRNLEMMINSLLPASKRIRYFD